MMCQTLGYSHGKNDRQRRSDQLFLKCSRVDTVRRTKTKEDGFYGNSVRQIKTKIDRGSWGGGVSKATDWLR